MFNWYSQKKQWTPVHLLPWCLRLKAHLLLLIPSGAQIKYTASPWNLGCSHITWRCNLLVFRLGTGFLSSFLAESSNSELLWRWAFITPIPTPILDLHGTFWTAKPCLKEVQFPDTPDKHCLCFAVRKSYAWIVMQYYCGSIVAFVLVIGSLRLNRSH